VASKIVKIVAVLSILEIILPSAQLILPGAVVKYFQWQTQQ